MFLLMTFLFSRTDKLPALGDALMILDFAAAQAAKRAPGIEHPQLCLGAIRAGIESGPLAGLKKVCLPKTA